MDHIPSFKFKLFGVFEVSGTGVLGMILAAAAVLLTLLVVVSVY